VTLDSLLRCGLLLLHGLVLFHPITSLGGCARPSPPNLEGNPFILNQPFHFATTLPQILWTLSFDSYGERLPFPSPLPLDSGARLRSITREQSFVDLFFFQ
jgi:hypothetical protein